MCSLVSVFVGYCVCWLVCLFVCVFVDWCVCLFMSWLIGVFVDWCVCWLVCLLIGVFVGWCVCLDPINDKTIQPNFIHMIFFMINRFYFSWVFASNWWFKPLIFEILTILSKRNHSLKYWIAEIKELENQSLCHKFSSFLVSISKYFKNSFYHKLKYSNFYVFST